MDPATAKEEPKPASSPPSHDNLQSSKAVEIVNACTRESLADLKSLAESKGGLLSDRLRQKAWLILLGLPLDDEKPEETAIALVPWQKLEPHRDEGQVKLDVDRAFVHYPARTWPPLPPSPYLPATR